MAVPVQDDIGRRRARPLPAGQHHRVATASALEVLSLTATRSICTEQRGHLLARAVVHGHSVVARLTGLSSQDGHHPPIAARTLFAIGTCPPDQANTWSSR